MFMGQLLVDTTKVLDHDHLFVVSQCRHLHNLKYLGGTSPEDEHLLSVIQNNTKLDHLEVRNQFGSDYGKTFSVNPLNKLSKLSCGIHASLLPLFTPCLLRLELHAGNKKDALLEQAAQQCPHLRSLRCMDAFASAFVVHCPLLVNLSVYCCTNLTDAGVLTIVQNLKHLRTLELFHAGPQLTVLALDHIAAHCAETLEILHMFIRSPVPTSPSIERFTKLHTFVWYTSHKAYYYWTVIQKDTTTVVLPDDVSIAHFNDLPTYLPRVDGLDVTRYRVTDSNKACDPLMPTLTMLLDAYPMLKTIFVSHKIVADVRNNLKGFSQVNVISAENNTGENIFDIMTLPI